MLDNKPVDVGDIVKGLEPRPELKAEPATVIPELASPPIAKADLNLDGEFKGLALKEDLGVKEVQAMVASAKAIAALGSANTPGNCSTQKRSAFPEL